jgi:hypothetical protein
VKRSAPVRNIGSPKGSGSSDIFARKKFRFFEEEKWAPMAEMHPAKQKKFRFFDEEKWAPMAEMHPAKKPAS